MAGDVYSAAPYVGRGGWSWYTGSAAWLYRAAVETLLGLAVQPGRLSLSPRLPAHWPAVELRLLLQGYDITVRWQRKPADGKPLQADQHLAWGEWVELDTLPEHAVLQVLAKRCRPFLLRYQFNSYSRKCRLRKRHKSIVPAGESSPGERRTAFLRYFAGDMLISRVLPARPTAREASCSTGMSMPSPHCLR